MFIKLKRSIEIIDTGVAGINFELSVDPNDAETRYKGFKDKTINSQYKISFLCGIWDKNKLGELLFRETDPWDLESAQDTRGLKFMQVSDEKIISWFNDQLYGCGAVRQGYWNDYVEDFFRKELMTMDFSKRGYFRDNYHFE